MSLLAEFNEHLGVYGGVLYWKATRRPAGDRYGRGKSIRFQNVRYNLQSVVDALRYQDASLLDALSLVEPERTEPKHTEHTNEPSVIAQLRLMLGRVNSIDDASDILRVIAIAEAQAQP